MRHSKSESKKQEKTDLQLIIDDDLVALKDRYTALERSMYSKWHYNFESFLDFQDWSVLPFMQAVRGIDINKIKKPESWKFYIQYYNYMRGYLINEANSIKNKVVIHSLDNMLDEDTTFVDALEYSPIGHLEAATANVYNRERAAIKKDAALYEVYKKNSYQSI